MKKRFILPVLIGGVVLAGCQTKEDKVKLNPSNEKKVIEIGEATAKELLKTLKGELKNALKDDPKKAIDVCSQKAIPLTKQVEERIDHGIKIKRTSFKYRNPANAPDNYEKEALRYFETKLKEEGKLPKYYIQIVKEDGKTYYRYYKPLKVAPVCLTCHGDKKYIDDNVYQKIKTIYPNDKAIGYKVGDFRGVIRVSIPEEALK